MLIATNLVVFFLGLSVAIARKPVLLLRENV